MTNDTQITNPTPFMTMVGGHVIIHDGTSGAPLADKWTGVCVDARNEAKFWLIGHHAGQRTFHLLQSKDLDAAQREAGLKGRAYLQRSAAVVEQAPIELFHKTSPRTRWELDVWQEVVTYGHDVHEAQSLLEDHLLHLDQQWSQGASATDAARIIHQAISAPQQRH